MRVRLSQADLNLRNKLAMPDAASLERGRQFFAQQARECFSLARKFPEMMPAALKFEAWAKLPDEQLADHWPLARAEALRRATVRAEMKSTQREHARSGCKECK